MGGVLGLLCDFGLDCEIDRKESMRNKKLHLLMEMEFLMIGIATTYFGLFHHKFVHRNTLLVFQTDEVQSDG